MSNIVIKAQGLSKKYLISHHSERERYTALRDVVSRKIKGAIDKTRQVLRGQQLLSGNEIEEFWALKNIDFEINRGDRVGIIGRNGAGKSTLLKVLSRITEPSTGRVEIRGRVASLLEVGTGFHPELSGRENIYLNGAILGMNRLEIKKKFDEIVDFAGIEKFLDTPVKRYSSGMYVRLAFAVAAHMEPEILVVDEVLAVGDAEFQKKCLGKMEDVSKSEGRTVLFVSHNLSTIKQLCNKGILLSHGKMLFEGDASQTIDKYLASNINSAKKKVFKKEILEDKEIQLVTARLSDSNNDAKDEFQIDESVYIHLEFLSQKSTSNAYGYIVIKNNMEQVMIESDTFDYLPNILQSIKAGINNFVIKIPPNILAFGEYTIYLAISENFINSYPIDVPGDILNFSIVDTTTIRGHQRSAATSCLLKWEQ